MRASHGSLGRAGLALLPCVMAVWFATRYLATFSEPTSYYPPFTDATTYVAAGERLNAGHQLYALVPGDRRVALEPSLSSAPILSPPPIAVLWRPLAAMPMGFALWVIAVWIALLGTTFFIAFRGGPLGLLATAVLSQSIGEQLAVANAAAFFPGSLLLVWRLRDRRVAGLIVGTIASLKLAPAAVIGWLLGSRSYRAAVASAVAVLLWLGLSVTFAGPDSLTAYLAIAGDIRPSPMSLAGRTGVPWSSVVALLALSAAGGIVSRRRPAVGFSITIAACVLGTPALYTSGWVTLLAAAAPLTSATPLAPMPRLLAANFSLRLAWLRDAASRPARLGRPAAEPTSAADPSIVPVANVVPG